MVWSDHSSVMNHGHLLLMISSPYDPAFHYTSTEMEARTGNKVDVQMLVEQPHVYILGRCSDTVVDQLCYTPYRLEDLHQMTQPLKNDRCVVDVMRFYHGDHPAISVEVGQQEGGHYACTGCSLHSALWTDVVACFRAGGLTIQQRLDKVLAGPAGRKRRNGGIHPFKKLTLDELAAECAARQLPVDHGQRLTKKRLQALLTEDLKGIQRVPALMFTCQNKDLETVNLTRYEALPSEPLHDIKEHIKNIVEELPKHLNEEETKAFDEVIETVLKSKDKQRGCDYRLCSIILAINLGRCARISIQKLLYTLAEMTGLIYDDAENRTPRYILRLHNVTFMHSMVYQKVFKKPLKLTVRKAFGIYWHSITSHIPLVARIISPSSTHTENEERFFNSINSISRTTSNGQPEHIIPNSILRLQAENSMKTEPLPLATQQSVISKYAANLPDFSNTFIPEDMLESEIYQAHLERISDFLLPGENVWWHTDEESREVVFHDSRGEPDWHPDGPPLKGQYDLFSIAIFLLKSCLLGTKGVLDRK